MAASAAHDRRRRRAAVSHLVLRRAGLRAGGAGARTRSRCGRRCLQRAQPFGITPYGLDALNTLRIEKGHITGAELNGNTSADGSGLRAPAEEAAVTSSAAPCRSAPALRAPRSAAAGRRAPGETRAPPAQRHPPGRRAGARPRASATSPPPRRRLRLDGWVGLALLAGGRGRIGQRLLAVSPVHGETHRGRDRQPAHARSGEPACPRLSCARSAGAPGQAALAACAAISSRSRRCAGRGAMLRAIARGRGVPLPRARPQRSRSATARLALCVRPGAGCYWRRRAPAGASASGGRTRAAATPRCVDLSSAPQRAAILPAPEAPRGARARLPAGS